MWARIKSSLPASQHCPRTPCYNACILDALEYRGSAAPAQLDWSIPCRRRGMNVDARRKLGSAWVAAGMAGSAGMAAGMARMGQQKRLFYEPFVYAMAKILSDKDHRSQ